MDPITRLRQLGYASLDAAEDALDPRLHEFFPCRDGHFDCARSEGGRCLGEVWCCVAEARELETT
jgi:hypothetical protein